MCTVSLATDSGYLTRISLIIPHGLSVDIFYRCVARDGRKLGPAAAQLRHTDNSCRLGPGSTLAPVAS